MKTTMTTERTIGMMLFAGLLLAAGAARAADAAKTGAGNTEPDPNYKPTRNLSRFFAKVKSGQPVTVMGIGGSVTAGNSWAPMSVEWLRKQCPGNQIHYVDCAFGGLPPWLMVFRMRRDILAHAPDLVFIEYAVNSYGDRERNWLAEDGMVQQLLRGPNQPEIVFVYVGAVESLKDKKRTLDAVKPVARHYGFHEVDVFAHLQKKIEAGELKWGDAIGDMVHPNRRGHAIYAEAVIDLFKQQIPLADKPTPVPPVPAPFFGDEFTTAVVLPIAAAQVSPEWSVKPQQQSSPPLMDEIYETDRPGATMTVRANTTMFGLFLIVNEASGRIAWSVDGGPETEFDLFNGFQYYSLNLLARGLPRGEHALKVKVLPKSERSKGNRVIIGGICVTNPKP